MTDLYSFVKSVVSAKSRRKSFSTLYGIDGNLYYERIISSFVRKKDLILPKVNGEIIFDLDKDINTIWDIVFIAQYVIDYWEQMIKNNDVNKSFYNDCLQKLKKITVQINSSYSLEQVSTQYLEELKKSIVIFQKIRDSIEHPNEQFKIGKILNVENVKGYFKVAIPIEYLEGFNKGKIIVKGIDERILIRTNEICFPLLEELGYDPKEIESFFYNIEPSQLSYLLKICDNQVDNLYKLPTALFYKKYNFNKILNALLKINNSKVLKEDDFAFLNKLDFDLGKNYIDNLMVLMYRAYKENNITKDDIVELARILSQAGLNILTKEDGIEFENKIIDNYYFIKGLINKSKLFGLSTNELPYSIYCSDDKTEIEKYVSDILFIKDKIRTFSDELSDRINFWFNHLIKIIDLSPYLEDVKDIFINTNIYASNVNQCGYILEFLLAIIGSLPIGVDKKNLKEYIKPNVEQHQRIKAIINDFKNNYKPKMNFEETATKPMIKSHSMSDDCTEIIEIVKTIKEQKMTFREYADKVYGNPKFFDIAFFKIGLYEEELNYLLSKTNDNYEISIKVIKKLSSNIIENTFVDNEISYDQEEYYNKKIKSNFKRNVDILLSKFDASKLLEYPSELLYSDERVFKHLFEHYNGNLCKSIFGTENPKIIATLIYLNSVLSKYNKNTVDISDIGIDSHKIILSTFVDTMNYYNCLLDNGIQMSQQDYRIQFSYDIRSHTVRNENQKKEFLLTKLRNIGAHFRFKLVRDTNGNIVDDKIYVYDEYNDGTNNFNMIIDINDLIEVIRQIELDMGQKVNLTTNYKSSNL